MLPKRWRFDEPNISVSVKIGMPRENGASGVSEECAQGRNASIFASIRAAKGMAAMIKIPAQHPANATAKFLGEITRKYNMRIRRITVVPSAARDPANQSPKKIIVSGKVR